VDRVFPGSEDETHARVHPHPLLERHPMASQVRDGKPVECHCRTLAAHLEQHPECPDDTRVADIFSCRDQVVAPQSFHGLDLRPDPPGAFHGDRVPVETARGVHPAVQVNGHYHRITCPRSMRVDDCVFRCSPEDRHVDDTVRRIRVQVPAHDGNPELERRIVHPGNDLLLDGAVGDGEDVHHRDGPPSHGCNIVDIDEDCAIPCPVRVRLHDAAPYPVCGKEKDFVSVFDHSGVLAERSEHSGRIDPDRPDHLTDGLLPPDALELPDCKRNLCCGYTVQFHKTNNGGCYNSLEHHQ